MNCSPPPAKLPDETSFTPELVMGPPCVTDRFSPCRTETKSECRCAHSVQRPSLCLTTLPLAKAPPPPHTHTHTTPHHHLPTAPPPCSIYPAQTCSSTQSTGEAAASNLSDSASRWPDPAVDAWFKAGVSTFLTFVAEVRDACGVTTPKGTANRPSLWCTNHVLGWV